MDSGKVKVALTATAGAIALYVLYRLLAKPKTPYSVGGTSDIFSGRIDPLSPIDVRQKAAQDFVVDFIKN